MAEKDITEKMLEAYNDVFADIVNVLLFDGKREVGEDELADAVTRSAFKADGKIHEQERDVAKFWEKENVRISLYGLENQSRPDRDMPLRLASYDGAGYKAQMLDDTRKERYPVVSLVLHFGMEKWNEPLTLKECLNIPDELEGYVNDYKMNLYQIAYLTEKQVNMFQSDFKVVAEYFTQKRTNKDYVPSPQTFQHVDAVLKLMAVMTGDHRFEEVLQESRQKGVPTNMCEVLDRVEARGEARGEAKTWEIVIRNIMKTANCTAEQAMNLAGAPDDIRQMYKERFPDQTPHKTRGR